MTPRLILLALIALVLPTATARADKLNVGVFVPSAPFASTSARQDYATRLAAHLAAATGDDGVGRVYARASDLASALKKGELDVALVDAAYLAAIGSPHPVLATATRDGKTSISWQLVTTGTETTIPELKGTTLQVAAIGGREAAFVNDALLGAELPADFFASVETSPDVASVLAALTLGKVHAAVVPGGVALPAGVRTVGTLDEVPWPALIASSAPSTPGAAMPSPTRRDASSAATCWVDSTPAAATRSGPWRGASPGRRGAGRWRCRAPTSPWTSWSRRASRASGAPRCCR